MWKINWKERNSGSIIQMPQLHLDLLLDIVTILSKF